MRHVFDLKIVMKMLAVSMVSGLSALLMLPLMVSHIMSPFVVSFLATLISVPLTWYFIDAPEGSIDFKEYYGERGLLGISMDTLLTFFTSVGLAAIFMYFLLSLEVLSVVAVSASAASGIFTGLSAFLFRNRSFFSDYSIDVKF